MSTAESAKAYARYFDRLRPESTHELKRLAHPDMRFVDPFNDVRGVDKVCAIFDHMFETTREPRFVTEPPIVGERSAFIKWRFTCRIESRFLTRPLTIDGVTEVEFDDQGSIIAHIDHWDAASQLYEKLPLLGSFLRFLRRRLAVIG